MATSHTNRMGDVYHLHQGKTPKGNPRYFFSRQTGDDLVDTVPEGYEIYEKPNGQVFLRKVVSREVTNEEVALVEAGVRRHTGLKVFRVDAEKASITVYTPDLDAKTIADITKNVGGLGAIITDLLADTLQQRSTFSAVMRFVLLNKEKRHFSVQHPPYRGEKLDWIWIIDTGPLADMIAKYTPYLTKESLFELM